MHGGRVRPRQDPRGVDGFDRRRGGIAGLEDYDAVVARVGDVHHAVVGARRHPVRLVELGAVTQAVGVRAEPERAGGHYKAAGVVKDLQAVVPRVRHDDAAVGVDDDVVRGLEPAVPEE